MPRLTFLRCTKCGKLKENGESLLKKKGDWTVDMHILQVQQLQDED